MVGGSSRDNPGMNLSSRTSMAAQAVRKMISGYMLQRVKALMNRSADGPLNGSIKICSRSMADCLGLKDQTNGGCGGVGRERRGMAKIRRTHC